MTEKELNNRERRLLILENTRRAYTRYCEILREEPNLDPDMVKRSVWKVYGRNVGTTVRTLPNIRSGLVSTSVITTEDGYRTANYTSEHYNSNQTVGEAAISLMERTDGQASDEEILAITEEGRKVHFVTSEENTRLTPIQNNNKDKDHTEHYAEANITLVPDPGTGGDYVVMLDGVPTNKKIIAAKLGMREDYVVTACDVKKWQNRLTKVNRKEYQAA